MHERLLYEISSIIFKSYIRKEKAASMDHTQFQFDASLLLGDLPLPNRAILAPLAGVSDVPFRRICQELGAGLTYVEMLSAVAVHRRNKRTMDMIQRHASEKMLGVQVTGSTAELVSDAVAFLSEEGFDTIDINMGCPVRKVVAHGGGSGFLREPDRISRTTEMARARTTKPLSVKCRIGLSREDVTVRDTAGRIVRGGADMITIHGRAREDNYSIPADYEWIRVGLATAREMTTRPLVTVGNGDVMSVQAAQRMVHTTGCDAVMVSRGALGNPWIFAELLSGHTVHPILSDWLDVVLRHIEYQEEHFGDTEMAAITLRKHLLWYIKGLPRSRELATRVGLVSSLNEARDILRTYTKEWPSDLIRFEEGHGRERRSDNHSRYDPKYEMDRTHDRGVGADGMDEQAD